MTILGQSQPRVSRHLKLLLEAGLVERRREGAWAFFHAPEKAAAGGLARAVLARLDASDPVLAADRERLAETRAARAAQAQKYFAEHAPVWDETRRAACAGGRGRGGDPFRGARWRAEGEASARHRLRGRPDAGIARASRRKRHRRRSFRRHARRGAGAARTRRPAQRPIAPGRHLSRCPWSASSVDLAVVHQVLHYLDNPARALREAALTLAPGGRLIVVDFAPSPVRNAARKTRASPARLRRRRRSATICGRRGLRLLSHRDLAPGDAAGERKTHRFPLAGARSGERQRALRVGLMSSSRGAAAAGTADRRVVRILSAETAGNGGGVVGGDLAPRAASSEVSSRSPMAPAARPASAPTPRSRASCARPTIKPAAHLTCVGATREEVDEVARAYWDVGVRHIVALRGDPQGGIGAAYAADARRLCQFDRTGRRPARHRRFRNLGRGLSGKTSRKRQLRAGHRRAQGQDRRGRDARHHPVLLRQRPLFPLSRPRRGQRGSRSRSCRA